MSLVENAWLSRLHFFSLPSCVSHHAARAHIRANEWRNGERRTFELQTVARDRIIDVVDTLLLEPLALSVLRDDGRTRAYESAAGGDAQREPGGAYPKDSH